MAEPSTALGRQAAFSANFLGTTNLAQRRRYQEDIEAARMEEGAAFDRQFEHANQLAEIEDPLKARTIRNQESQFKQNLTMREKQMALQEQRFRLEEKKADYATRKALREQATAERMLADTDAVEQADFDLRQAGFEPGTKQYADGILKAVITHNYIDPDFRRTIMKAAEFEEDPDELMSNIKKDMKNPVTTVYVSPEGKKRFVVREGGTAGSSTPNSAAMKYATATAAQQSGRANLDEVTKAWEANKTPKETAWWEPSDKPDKEEVLRLEKEVQKRQAELREADAMVSSLRSQFPELGQQAKADSSTAAVGPTGKKLSPYEMEHLIAVPATKAAPANTPTAAPVRMKYVDGKLVPVQ